MQPIPSLHLLLLQAATNENSLPSAADLMQFLAQAKPGVLLATSICNSLGLLPFEVSEHETLETLKGQVSMLDFCNKNLTEKNFGIPDSAKKLQGGFLRMPQDFTCADTLAVVRQLSALTNRKFRLGTPKEALTWIKQALPRPKRFVVSSKVFASYALNWHTEGEHVAKARFGLLPLAEEPWNSKCRVFVVEELPFVEPVSV